MSIRLANENDLEAMLAIYAPYVTDTAVSFEYSVPTLEEFTQRFRTITVQFPWLVWEEDGRVLGYAYGSAPFERAAFGWCAEPSIYLARSIQGKHIGTKLYAVLEEILRQQGYCRLYALITTENIASVEFHKAVGYTFLARFPDCGFKLNRWHGLIWMEKVLNSVEMPSNFPVPASCIVNTAGKTDTLLANLSLS